MCRVSREHERARLGVEKDGRHHGTQVTILAREGHVAIRARTERGAHGGHIARRRVTRDEPLDQAVAHERSDTLMEEQMVEQRLGLVQGVTLRRVVE